MEKFKEQIEEIFKQLDKLVEAENLERRENGAPILQNAEVRLLGQASLLVNSRVSAVLSLALTGDLDALLKMESFTKESLKKILHQHGLVYDEDSHLVWIPDGAVFEELLVFENVIVKIIDPESALVSKAVKAPQKNKQLVRQAIASGEFPRLAARIICHGGDLEFFGRD